MLHNCSLHGCCTGWLKFTVCCQSIYVCQLANISPRHQYLWCYFSTLMYMPISLLNLNSPAKAPFHLYNSLFSHTRSIPQMSSPHILRWALTLSAYQYTISFKSGKTLSNADNFSLLPLPQTHTCTWCLYWIDSQLSCYC